MSEIKVKKLDKTKWFRVGNDIWSITPRANGIMIDLCRPGEELLTHPEGNEVHVTASDDTVLLSRASE